MDAVSLKMDEYVPDNAIVVGMDHHIHRLKCGIDRSLWRCGFLIAYICFGQFIQLFMKRYTKIAVLAICLASCVNSFGFAETQISTIENFGPGNNPNGIHPRLARCIIDMACDQMEMSSQTAWVNYVQGVNTIEIIPDYYRVTLLSQGGTFVIVDIIDDL